MRARLPETQLWTLTLPRFTRSSASRAWGQRSQSESWSAVINAAPSARSSAWTPFAASGQRSSNDWRRASGSPAPVAKVVTFQRNLVSGGSANPVKVTFRVTMRPLSAVSGSFHNRIAPRAGVAGSQCRPRVVRGARPSLSCRSSHSPPSLALTTSWPRPSRSPSASRSN